MSQFTVGSGGNGGSITLDGDSGSATGSIISIVADQSSLGCGSSVAFSGSSATLLLQVTDSQGNTIIGKSSGTGSGFNNVGLGPGCLAHVNADSSENVAIGASALQELVSGNNNVAIGVEAGSNYTGGEGGNILIGALCLGVQGESNVTRIGFAEGSSSQEACYIDGIHGVTTSGSAVAVLIDSTGNLGTVSSSLRYKELIRDMGKSSDFVYQLRPVTFSYIKDKSQQTQIGLIAEEVEKIYPNLVVYDGEGRPDAVKYHELPVLLLNEIQKLKKEIEQLKGKA